MTPRLKKTKTRNEPESSRYFSREEALALVEEFYRLHPRGTNRQLMQYMQAGSLATARRWKQEYHLAKEA